MIFLCDSFMFKFNFILLVWFWMMILLVGCLDSEMFKEFKLVKRTELSHNVAKFRFALPTSDSVLGLPIGQHISCRFVGFHISNIWIWCFDLIQTWRCFNSCVYLQYWFFADAEEKMLMVRMSPNLIHQQHWIQMLGILS